MENSSFIEAAIKASVAAGAILMKYYDEKVEVSSKESSRDIVSEVDKLAEDKIIEILEQYDDSISIITEERDVIHKKSRNKFWVIDPLDGTVNYINHIPFFAVSIAYVEDDVIQGGAIYAPMFDDIYYATKSIGAFKNHKAITVKDSSFKESLFSVSFSGKKYDPTKRHEEFALFANVNDESRGCLRTGSAALNLAYLAEGRLSGCFGKATKYWDVAAGLVIAEAAGAKITTKQLDREKNLFSYVAATKSVATDLNRQVKNVLDL